MSVYVQTRNTLKTFLEVQSELANEINVGFEPITETMEHLKHGELSIAVVGEVNRGKSTFLNALMGTKLFPSRASVCTAGVTLLDYGEVPHAEIIYNNGKTESFDLDLDNPAKTLVDIVSRKNQNVQKIKMVRLQFPNPFTGNGLVLVDTPGVNDPETWREEITYEYLSGADAIIMLLDPMQPVSESEIEFLEHKILGRSIANLLFVVNKMDDVSAQDRAVALGRIENILKKYVPNPMIFPVASKPALMAKKVNDVQGLNVTGFPEFEESLMEFLSKGRGGALLRSKIQKGMDHLTNVIQFSMDQRMGALDSEVSSVQSKLERANKDLKSATKDKDDMTSEIQSKGKAISNNLKSIVSERKQYLNDSLKSALLEEPDVSVLRSNVLDFQKDCVGQMQNGIELIYGNLISEYGDKSTSMMSNISGILSSLSNEASVSVQSLKVSHEKVQVNSNLEDKKTGAAIGGVLSAGAGVAVASTATTVGITAIGTIGTVAAFGTMATIGIGILTGGVGLLLGAALGGMLSESSSSSSSGAQSSYVEYRETINNKRALLAVNRFVSKLMNNITLISNKMIRSLVNDLVTPLDQQINSQNKLISQIKSDIEQTVDCQESTRIFLTERIKDSAGLKEQYSQLIMDIEQL